MTVSVLTPRERFIRALERKPLTGQVPHFELVFFLTMEAFGRVHPNHRNYEQWMQMSPRERELHRRDMAELHVLTAERFHHSAIFLHINPWCLDEIMRMVDHVRELSGDRYFLMVHGDGTFEIPNGQRMLEWIAWLYERFDDAKVEAERRVNERLDMAEQLAKHGGLDGFALCSDYCYNDNPFLGPDMFGEIITPYLARNCQGMRDLGFHVIKHTDGNIMPIIDQLVQAHPHALHSLDPQGGVDIAEVKQRFGREVCLIGNVNCGLLNSGTDEEVVDSARYCLRHGMPGGGYVFSTSNCIYTGMELARYELMLRVWQEEGIYQEAAAAAL